MHSSSVLIVHPSADRFRLPDMANGKLNRHYSLDSPSLTSPPGYVSDPLVIDQKPPTFSMSMSMPMSMPTTTTMPIGSSPHQFPSFNPHLVMAPTAPPGLLHISKYKYCSLNSQPLCSSDVAAFCKLQPLLAIYCHISFSEPREFLHALVKISY